mgnify:CR=1 FL=1
MKLVYLYTNLNWYRIELFRSIAKLMDCHIYILNGYTVGYQNIEYKPEYEDLNITFLSPEESKFQKLYKILDKEEFDSIVVPSMNDAFYLKLTTKLSHYYHRRGKTVLYFWEYWPMDKGTFGPTKWFKQEIRHFFTRLNKKSISYFITPSINTYSFYQRMNIPSGKLIRCLNVSEIKPEKEESQSQLRKDLGIRDEEKIVLFFGRIEEYKGIHELINVFKKINNNKWHLLICGPGEDKIADEITGFKNIHALGSVKPEERNKYYKTANLFILANTYKNKIEPWGLTINEAMGFGLPIIASNATGSAIDLIFSGLNGYVIDSYKLEDELEYYIKKILSNNEIEKKMGKNSKQIVSKYTFDNMALAFYVATEKGNR